MNFEEQPRTTVISTQQNTDYLYSRFVAVGTDTRTTTQKYALNADKDITCWRRRDRKGFHQLKTNLSCRISYSYC